MKGIVLAGGAGTRLHPITRAVTKQLLPVYDKPMIYYPISVLMFAGIRDILLITTPHEQEQFRRLLGDGNQWGITLSYATQPSPDGLAQALLIGADHLAGEPATLVLGDNLFFGHGLPEQLRAAALEVKNGGGCALFGYRVANPQDYGVAVLSDDGALVDIEEKPEKPPSDLAITGLYMYDADAVEYAGRLQPSARGELEITDLSRIYIHSGKARLFDLGRGMAWLDTGTQDSLMQAGQFVQVLQARQGVTIACLEEIAMRLGLISGEQALALADQLGKSGYARYLRQAAQDFLAGRP